MVMSIVSFLVSVIAILLLTKVIIAVIKGLLKSVAIKLSKIMFFINTVLISGTIASVGPALIVKDTDKVHIPVVFGFFIGCFILFQLLGNNVNFSAGWAIVRTIYNIADGYLLGSLLIGFLQEKNFMITNVLRSFIYLATALVMFIATYLERRKREYEGA